jgi:hypothetical protein
LILCNKKEKPVKPQLKYFASLNTLILNWLVLSQPIYIIPQIILFVNPF